MRHDGTLTGKKFRNPLPAQRKDKEKILSEDASRRIQDWKGQEPVNLTRLDNLEIFLLAMFL